MFTYKILPNLPTIPDKYQSYMWDLYANPGTNHNQYVTPTYAGRPLLVDGKVVTSTQSSRHEITDVDFVEWLRENIVPSWIKCGLSITKTNSELSVHGVHTDHTRPYILIYLLDTGGDDAVVSWYQEQGKPVFRGHDLGQTIYDYSTISVVDQLKLPTHTWALYEVRVLHGVENIARDRVSIQLSLSENDLLALKSINK
jgi:hypothetical protein